jgi:kynurenine formamidase
VPDMPAFAPGAAAGPLVRLKVSMANGSEYNLSELRMECHTGTHVDAPGHINQRHFAAGRDVDTLDLDVLNGAPIFSWIKIDALICHALLPSPARHPLKSLR